MRLKAAAGDGGPRTANDIPWAGRAPPTSAPQAVQDPPGPGAARWSLLLSVNQTPAAVARLRMSGTSRSGDAFAGGATPSLGHRLARFTQTVVNPSSLAGA